MKEHRAMGSSVLYLAAAGAGKTRLLVNRALSPDSGRVLLTTYTDENTEVISSEIRKRPGSQIRNVEVLPWFTFLLRHGVKPFLGSVGFGNVTLSGVQLVNGRSAPYAKKRTGRYYFAENGRVYSDKLASLALLEDDATNGLLVARIASIFDTILIDEVQDISDPDLDFIARLLRSGCSVIMAGDQRQHTFSTNNAARNSSFRSLGLESYLERNGLKRYCKIDKTTLNGSHRCNQGILDVANALFPGFPETTSIRNPDRNDAHSGVFLVRKSEVRSYIEKWSPTVLRYDAKSRLPDGIHAINFGRSKGSTFDRVLLFPCGSILNWVKGTKGDELSGITRAKFYVALTRARYSAAIVVDPKFECSRKGVSFWREMDPED